VNFFDNDDALLQLGAKKNGAGQLVTVKRLEMDATSERSSLSTEEIRALDGTGTFRQFYMPNFLCTCKNY